MTTTLTVDAGTAVVWVRDEALDPTALARHLDKAPAGARRVLVISAPPDAHPPAHRLPPWLSRLFDAVALLPPLDGIPDGTERRRLAIATLRAALR